MVLVRSNGTVLNSVQAAPQQPDWKPFAEKICRRCPKRGESAFLRSPLSTKNPLDPSQSEFARTTFLRAIDVASHIGVKTVAGFPGRGDRVERPIPRATIQFINLTSHFSRACSNFGNRSQKSPLTKVFASLLSIARWVLITCRSWDSTCWRSRPCGKTFSVTHVRKISAWNGIPANLICQFIDPVANAAKFGSRIFHVHAEGCLYRSKSSGRLRHLPSKSRGASHSGVWAGQLAGNHPHLNGGGI